MVWLGTSFVEPRRKGDLHFEKQENEDDRQNQTQAAASVNSPDQVPFDSPRNQTPRLEQSEE